MKLNSKKVIVILAVLTVAVYFFLNFEKEVREGQIVYSKTEPEVVVEITEEQAKEVILNNFPFSEEDIEDEITEENKGDDFEKREIVPYTKALPPMPTEDEAKYGFPDVNKNKVRDDIEIGIVEAFEDDAMMVESFFASARAVEYDIYLAKNNLLTRENLKVNLSNVSLDVECGANTYESFYAKESRWRWMDMNNRYVYSKVRNTQEKKDLIRKLERASHGMLIPGGTHTQEECISFFKSTLELPIGG